MDMGLFYTIFTTVFLLVLFGAWLVIESYYLGGDYYVFGNYARKKTFFEKFFDGLKIELEALLYNSYGECENGWCAESYTVSGAVKKLEDVSLSGSPDCEMTTDFELYYDDVLIYKGDWTRLRELAAIEEKERSTFMSANRAEFTEQKFLDFMYKKREWLIKEIYINCDGDCDIGIWEGTQHDVIDYCHQHESDEAFYSYRFIDRLN